MDSYDIFTYSAVSNGLHAIAAVIWVGGMFIAHMALRPSVAVLEPPQRLALWAGVFPRFFRWVWVSIVVLFATGLGTVFIDFGGFGGTPVHVHLMLTVSLVMLAVYATIYFGPFRAFMARVAARDWPAAAEAQAVIRKLVATNLVLGLLTVAIGAAGRFWG